MMKLIIVIPVSKWSGLKMYYFVVSIVKILILHTIIIDQYAHVVMMMMGLLQ